MTISPAARKRMFNIVGWSVIAAGVAFIVLSVLCVRSCYVAVLLGE